MKRCPECRRDYSDETLNFCLDDGSPLLDGPGAIDEPATAAFRVFEEKTRAFATSLPGGTSQSAQFASRPHEGSSNSIAVLPFANLSGDVENEYFCDGLADEL